MAQKNAAAADDGWSHEVTHAYLQRLKSGTFILPGEACALLENAFHSLVRDIADSERELFTTTQDEALSVEPKESWGPDDYEAHVTPKYREACRRRGWWGNVLIRLHKLAEQFGIDQRPLLWWSRYITSGRQLTEADKREIQDCLSLLNLQAIKVAEEHYASTSSIPSSKPPVPKRKIGRPIDTDAAEDKRVYEAWQTGQHATKAALAIALGSNWSYKKVVSAIGRHSKRLTRALAKSTSPN